MDAVAERRRNPDRDLLRAADEARLLRSVARVEVALERARVLLVARRGDVEQHEQERQLTRLGAEDRPGGGGHERLEARRDAVGIDPALECLAVPAGRVRGGPRGVDGDLGRHLIELLDDLDELGGDRRVRRRGAERTAVAVARRGDQPQRVVDVVDVQIVAGVIGRERPHADGVGQRHDLILGRSDERRAALGHLTAAEVVVPGPPADSVARLEHDHRVAGARDLAGGGQAGEAGADHDHIGLVGFLLGCVFALALPCFRLAASAAAGHAAVAPVTSEPATNRRRVIFCCSSFIPRPPCSSG